MARKLGSRQAPKSGNGGDGRPLDKTDNMTAEDKKKALDEADQVQLISGLSQLKPLISAAEVLKAQLKEAQDAVTNKKKTLSGALRCDVKVINEILEDQAATRKDVTAKEAMRARIRRFAAQPAGDSEEQLELVARMPAFEQDLYFWEAMGFAAGLRGDDRTPPDGVPGDQAILQAFDKGWMKGQAENIGLLSRSLARQEPVAPAPKEETEIERRRREKKEEAAAKAALAKMPPAALEAEGDKILAAGDSALAAIAEAEPEIVAQVLADHGEADDFEATPEELAAQVARRPADEEVI